MKVRRPFHFKQFSIIQENSSMPVTTDACIFGALANFDPCKTILDIGTGTGLLSLMLAQRYPDVQITAIESDELSFQEALKNFTASPWSERLTALHGNIVQWNYDQKFDGIICNPPFFENHLPSEKVHKRIARHAAELNYKVLVDILIKLMSDNGIVWLLIPNVHIDHLEEIAKNHGLFAQEKIAIKATDDKETHVWAIALGCHFKVHNTQRFTTYTADREYTTQARELLSPFYTSL